MKYTFLDKIKHFWAFISYLFFTIVDIVKDKRTWLVVAFIVWTYLIAWFNANYYTQSPVKQWQPMIVPRHTTKQVKKAPTMTVKASENKKQVVVPKSEKEIVLSQKWGDVLWKIYQLETQRGLTDYCRQSGKYGGFGVMNDKNKPHCYDTFQEATERANYWFDKLHPEKSLVSALCQWNTGTPNLVNCFYYQHYLNVK